MNANETTGVLVEIGRKLDHDISEISSSLDIFHERLDRLESKVDALLEERKSSEYTISVPEYDVSGAWTSTVLFKEEEEPEVE
jgi:hypothetical protein